MPFDRASEDVAGNFLRPQVEQSSPRWEQLAEYSRRQDGVLHIEHLRAVGVSDGRVGLLLAQGRLRREFHGVYSDALMIPTPRARLRAALLAVGPTAFLSGRTALALHGLRSLNLHAIEVRIHADHTPRHQGITVHRTAVEPLPDEIRIRDRLRSASAPLALLQVAARETPVELDRLVTEMVRHRLLDLSRIHAVIARRRGLRGITKLREAPQRFHPDSTYLDRSGFEKAFAAWLDTLDDIPEPERNVRVGPWELDFHWPDHHLVVETDGDRYHLTPAEHERDVMKDAWLQRHGRHILRVTEFRFAHDRVGIEADLRGLLDAEPMPDPEPANRSARLLHSVRS